MFISSSVRHVGIADAKTVIQASASGFEPGIGQSASSSIPYTLAFQLKIATFAMSMYAVADILSRKFGSPLPSADGSYPSVSVNTNHFPSVIPSTSRASGAMPDASMSAPHASPVATRKSVSSAQCITLKCAVTSICISVGVTKHLTPRIPCAPASPSAHRLEKSETPKIEKMKNISRSIMKSDMSDVSDPPKVAMICWRPLAALKMRNARRIRKIRKTRRMRSTVGSIGNVFPRLSIRIPPNDTVTMKKSNLFQPFVK
mmetsp:Transcript_39307/g.93018  ORF Transcript_39307/g.93018 Transcript_39307/m.93018 type:complete len:259 (+) Transcript_39307:385-1161(+)